jgi:hypothetical protein
VTTSRKLEDIASNLDDMSVTLEEIKEEIKGADRRDADTKLDKVQSDMERTADVIEESLENKPPKQ